MEDETIVLNREDINNIVTDVRASVQAIEKGSKLRKHMMNMIAMNNIMRAFIYNYDTRRLHSSSRLILAIASIS